MPLRDVLAQATKVEKALSAQQAHREQTAQTAVAEKQVKAEASGQLPPSHG